MLEGRPKLPGGQFHAAAFRLRKHSACVMRQCRRRTVTSLRACNDGENDRARDVSLQPAKFLAPAIVDHFAHADLADRIDDCSPKALTQCEFEDFGLSDNLIDALLGIGHAHAGARCDYLSYVSAIARQDAGVFAEIRLPQPQDLGPYLKVI